MTGIERHPFASRLKDWPDPRLAVVLDKRVDRQMRYFAAQLDMDMAHTVMLADQDVISAGEAAQILRVLDALRVGGPNSLPRKSARSSLFWYIEARLIDELGEQTGGRMHTGRSHNDIMPTVSRLTARDQLTELIACVIDMQDVLLQRGAEHVTTIMPGYTAMQHGQPWTFGHYLSGWFYAFERDVVRLQAAYANTNRSSLGASALAGTSWPLDRQRTADLLGFDTVLANSRDAGFCTRDYVAETLAAIAILMTNVNALCSDLYLWSSYEFGMVTIGDGFSGTSSFMPQKKNAWAVDWTRGAAAAAIGHLVSSLTAFRGSSSTDGALQDYPEAPLAEAFETTLDHLRLIIGTVETLEVNEALMMERARANWTTASNLADVIARERGLSFRAAHGVVGRVVRLALERGLRPDDVTGRLVDEAAVAVHGAPLGLNDETVRSALDPVAFIESRVTLGSVRPDETRRMLDDGAARLAAERRWLETNRAHTAAAAAALRFEVERLLAG